MHTKSAMVIVISEKAIAVSILNPACRWPVVRKDRPRGQAWPRLSDVSSPTLRSHCGTLNCRLTTKLSDGAPTFQHAGAPALVCALGSAARGRALYASRRSLQRRVSRHVSTRGPPLEAQKRRSLPPTQQCDCAAAARTGTRRRLQMTQETRP